MALSSWSIGLRFTLRDSRNRDFGFKSRRSKLMGIDSAREDKSLIFLLLSEFTGFESSLMGDGASLPPGGPNS